MYVCVLCTHHTCVVKIDAAQLREQATKRLLWLVDGGQCVVGQDEGLEARVHEAKLAHLGPVLQPVVRDVQQLQGGTRHI